MPRDASGFYTLPSGNPVVPGSVIESRWANSTMSDLAAAMTDSLSRSGQGSMLGPLVLSNGTTAIGEAPNDGKQYARKNLTWAEIIIPDPPLGNYVLKAGDTMTGTLNLPTLIVKSGGPEIVMDAQGDGGHTIWGRSNGSNRWQLRIGDGNDSAGIDANNFALYRHDQAGNLVGTHLFAGFRSDGRFDVPNLSSAAANITTLTAPTIYTTNIVASGLTNTANAYVSGRLYIGDYSDSSYWMSQDANTKYFHYQSGWYWSWNRADGTLTWNNGNGHPVHLTANGPLQCRSLYIAYDGGFSLAKDGADNRILHWAGGAAYFQWQTNGTLYIVNGSAHIMQIPYGQSGINISGPSSGFRYENITNATLNAMALGRNINDNSIRFRADGTNVGGVTLNVSDVGLKQDIVALVNDEAKFMAVSPINFRWRDDPEGIYSSEKLQEGFSAQNVQESFPDMIMEGEHLGINHFGLIARLWMQVKYLTQRVAQLENP